MLRIERMRSKKIFWIVNDDIGKEVVVALDKRYFKLQEIIMGDTLEATAKEFYDALVESDMLDELFEYLGTLQNA